MKRKKIALVCCRGGSKGIKGKNIKLFCGKPLLYWTFNNIRNSNLFDLIYLSTDSKIIASYSKKIGFVIPQLRPKYLAKDNSDVFDTHNFFFKKNNITDKNSIVCIINNNPFITSNIIRKSYYRFKKKNYKFITMCSRKVDTEFIFYRQSIKKKNRLFPIFSKLLISSKINRQQSLMSYVNIGDLRWGIPSKLINYKNFNIEICKDGFENIFIKSQQYHDLNDLNDWKMAENKFKKL